MIDYGQITIDGGVHTIRFERRLGVAPEEVWSALTEPVHLAAWLAEAVVVPGLEGEIVLDFGEGGRESGRITVWDPPRALAYEWNFVGEAPSHVSWRLAAVDDARATLLTLEHSRLDPEVSTGYGAGWHAHLDQLDGHLAGSVPDWDTRFGELRPHYEEIATAASRR
jgi:uncharacterized protein YndB with AHSA1/START domain